MKKLEQRERVLLFQVFVTSITLLLGKFLFAMNKKN